MNPIPAALDPDPLDGNYCVTVYVEVDHGIVQDKGPVGSRTYVQGLLGEVAALYAAQDITLSYIVKYWDTPSPYTGTSSSELLNQFRAQTANNHDGDVAHLISYQASGGIAYVDVICRASFGHAFSSIRSTYEAYPTYSWSVEVFAHELGHNLGSPHTQSCVWNGNNTAIDACSPFGTEGGCPEPPDPVGGGTIMSYCHLNANVGINFLKGFHPQPLALIKNRIANAQCVECVSGPDDPDPETCSENQVIIELQLDNYSTETSWQVLDDDGLVVAASRPFTKLEMNTYHNDTLCLPDGCYSFVISDPDGLAGYGCGEGMYILNGPAGELASGMSFTDSETTQFSFNCAPPAGDCHPAPIRKANLVDYANQSRARSPMIADVTGGDGVEIGGNYWQAQPLAYTLTPGTVLTGEVWVEDEGEINGVGLVDNLTGIYPGQSFRFAGNQAWGIPIDQVPVGGWHPIRINVGQYLAGMTVTHLVLVNDDDAAGSVQTAWKNFELCESGAEMVNKAALAQVQGTAEDEMWEDDEAAAQRWIKERAAALRPYPVPATDTIHLPHDAQWHMYSLRSVEVLSGTGKTAVVQKLKAGVYFIRQNGQTYTIIKQ